jgi:hypothetical protein
MEKITAQAPNVRLDIVPWRGPAIFTAEFARTIDLVISIGDAFRDFTGSFSTPIATRWRCGAVTLWERSSAGAMFSSMHGTSPS